ncbi:MAG: DUF2947 family protein [Flavipsychrobacter sp.]|nr:DUF2947 family protein [Flavipsychrobacter sp.]
MGFSLENIEEFKIPLDDYISKWIFTDENEQLASKEHQDQIFPLTKEAANFLWDHEVKIGIICSEKFFKNISAFDGGSSGQQTIKKYLYNLGIPFSQKVFIAQQPDTAFVLTWKMVIKYSHNLFFAHDQIVWDRTLNWQLEFHHDGLFTFGRDFIYDGQSEMQKNKEKTQIALKEMAERKNRHGFD